MMIFTYVIAQCQLLAAVKLAFVYYLSHRAKFTPEVIKKMCSGNFLRILIATS